MYLAQFLTYLGYVLFKIENILEIEQKTFIMLLIKRKYFVWDTHSGLIYDYEDFNQSNDNLWHSRKQANKREIVNSKIRQSEL